VRQPAWRMPALFFNRTVVISSTLYPMERLSQEFGAGDRRFTSLWRVIGRGFGGLWPPQNLFGGGARGGFAAPRTPTEDGIWRAKPSRPPNSRCNIKPAPAPRPRQPALRRSS